MQDSPLAVRDGHFRRLTRVGYQTLSVSLGLGLVVSGTGLVALAIAIVWSVLRGDTVAVAPTSVHAVGSAFVLAVVGWLGFGASWDGLLNRRAEGVYAAHWERAIIRAVAFVLVGLGLVVVADFAAEYVGEFSESFLVGAAYLRAVGVAGYTLVPLVGVPTLWALDLQWPDSALVRALGSTLVYAIWLLAVIILHF